MSLKEDGELLNHILECEQTAAAVYESLLSEGAHYPQVWALNSIKDDHKQACGRLKRQIEALGIEPTRSQTAAAYRGVERSRMLKVFEDFDALKALRDGEAQELEDCRRALSRESRYGPSRTTVEAQMIPVLEQHVQYLDLYLARQIPTITDYMR